MGFLVAWLFFILFVFPFIGFPSYLVNQKTSSLVNFYCLKRLIRERSQSIFFRKLVQIFYIFKYLYIFAICKVWFCSYKTHLATAELTSDVRFTHIH